MSQPLTVLFWILVATAAVIAFGIYPNFFSETEIFAVLVVCAGSWFIMKSRRARGLKFSVPKARYRDSTGKTKLIVGLALLAASFAWIAISLPRISDTWGEVILIAFGPAVLLLVVGSIVFWLGVYRMFLKNTED